MEVKDIMTLMLLFGTFILAHLIEVFLWMSRIFH
ncbi:putative holin-like toxin [Paenibacillus sp. TC-CSREp1]